MPPPAPRTGEGDDADIARVQRQVARRRDADAVLLLLPPAAASPPKGHPDGPQCHAAVCASRSHEQRAGGRGRGRHGDACRGLAVRREEGDDGGGGSGDRCIGGTASGPVVGARGRRREEVAGEVERVVGDDGDGLRARGGGKEEEACCMRQGEPVTTTAGVPTFSPSSAMQRTPSPRGLDSRSRAACACRRARKGMLHYDDTPGTLLPSPPPTCVDTAYVPASDTMPAWRRARRRTEDVRSAGGAGAAASPDSGGTGSESRCPDAQPMKSAETPVPSATHAAHVGAFSGPRGSRAKAQAAGRAVPTLPPRVTLREHTIRRSDTTTEASAPTDARTA